MRPDAIQTVILISALLLRISKAIEIEVRRVIGKHRSVTNEASCHLPKPPQE